MSYAPLLPWKAKKEYQFANGRTLSFETRHRGGTWLLVLGRMLGPTRTVFRLYPPDELDLPSTMKHVPGHMDHATMLSDAFEWAEGQMLTDLEALLLGSQAPAEPKASRRPSRKKTRKNPLPEGHFTEELAKEVMNVHIRPEAVGKHTKVLLLAGEGEKAGYYGYGFFFPAEHAPTRELARRLAVPPWYSPINTYYDPRTQNVEDNGALVIVSWSPEREIEVHLGLLMSHFVEGKSGFREVTPLEMLIFP